jgi:hypothetical protein
MAFCHGGTVLRDWAVLNPDEYRLKADECVRLAAQATDPNVQAAYEEVARSYRHLAAEVEMWQVRMHEDPKK